MSGLGLIPAQQTMSNVKTNRFLTVGQPIVSPEIISPLTITASNLAVGAVIEVEGEPLNSYQGAISFTTGENTNQTAPARDALTLVSETGGTLAYIGEDNTNGNVLAVNGTTGLGFVYNTLYNQPVSLKNITLTNVSPTNIVDTNNPGEIFRCVQAGVLASFTSAIGCTLQVPRTGFYTVAIEVKVANAPAPASQSVVLPIGVATGPLPIAGTNIGSTLSFQFTGPDPLTSNTPYGVMQVNAMELSQTNAYAVNGSIVRQYTYMQKFNEEDEYTFLFKSDNVLLNIGAVGQIKAELIAMC